MNAIETEAWIRAGIKSSGTTKPAENILNLRSPALAGWLNRMLAKYARREDIRISKRTAVKFDTLFEPDQFTPTESGFPAIKGAPAPNIYSDHTNCGMKSLAVADIRHWSLDRLNAVVKHLFANYNAGIIFASMNWSQRDAEEKLLAAGFTPATDWVKNPNSGSDIRMFVRTTQDLQDLVDKAYKEKGLT